MLAMEAKLFLGKYKNLYTCTFIVFAPVKSDFIEYDGQRYYDVHFIFIEVKPVPEEPIQLSFHLLSYIYFAVSQFGGVFFLTVFISS